MTNDGDERGPVRPRERRWLWPVLGAAGLVTLIIVAAAWSTATNGRRAVPAASAGVTTAQPSRRDSARIDTCAPTPRDGILTCPGRSPDLPPGVTPEQYAAAEDQSRRVLDALGTIDFCGPGDPVPCPPETGPPAVCEPGPCPRRTSLRGVRRVVAEDVTLIRAALDRAGFTAVDVTLLDDPPGIGPTIRYAVPAGPVCLVGIMFTTDPPPANDIGGVGSDGRC